MISTTPATCSPARWLIDMAETNLIAGEPLPRPDTAVSDPEADLEEPIHLLLTASNRVATVGIPAPGQ